MAGILAAVSAALNIADTAKALADENTSNRDKTKLLLEKLEKGTLIETTGDMTKLLSKYIISPTIIVTHELKNSDILYNLVQIQTDIFAAYYAQAFNVLNNLRGFSTMETISLLGSHDEGLAYAAGRVGLKALGKFSKESLEDYSLNLMKTNVSNEAVDWRNEMLKQASKADPNRYSVDNIASDPTIRREYVNMLTQGTKLNKLTGPDRDEIAKNMAAITNAYVNNWSKKEFDDYLALINNPKTTQEDLIKFNQALIQQGIDPNILSDSVRRKLDLKRSEAEALERQMFARAAEFTSEIKFKKQGEDIPDTYAVFERQIDIKVLTTNNVGDSGEKIKHYIQIPMTVKANVIFTSYANIENVVSPRKEDKSFWYRLTEWRAGGISFWELITAKDLIKKYKENKIRDTDNILSHLNKANASAFFKGVGNDRLHEGYQQFYNMIIINSEQKERLEAFIGGKLSADRYKDKFLNMASSMTITTVDEDYEKVIIQTKDIGGEAIVPFKNVKRRRGEKEDLTDIFKAMLQSKAPVFA